MADSANVNQSKKSRRKTFRKRFVSGSLLVSPCFLQSETKIEPDLRLCFALTSEVTVFKSIALTWKKTETAPVIT